jgi:hypothetical protein
MEGQIKMSAVASHDLQIAQGATYSQVINWKTGSTPAFVNTTGYTARMQLRTSYSAASASLELTTSNSRISLTNAGVITLSLTATETAALAAGRYVYDLEMVSSGGQVTRLLEGVVTVSPEVTR